MNDVSQDCGSCTAKLAPYRARRRDVQAGNMKLLFEALGATGTAAVVVSLKSNGNAGQIESVSDYVSQAPGSR